MPHNLLRLCRHSPRFAKQYLRKQMGLKEQRRGDVERSTHLPVIVGLVDGRNVPFIRDGTDFLYVDHSYFNRDTGWRTFRIIRKGHHLTRVVDRPDDRLKRFGVQILPWRKGGKNIVVIPPSTYYATIYGKKVLLETMVRQLKEHTDRKLMVKDQKGGLQEYLQHHDAWAVVCSISAAGAHAALLGYPVFSTDLCASWPISSGPLTAIESPQYPERHAWACSLAYACWTLDELDDLDLRDYDYQRKGG